MSDFEITKKMLDVLAARVFEMIRLGKVKLNSGGKTQTLQIETARGEIIENVKHLEPYGVTSKAPINSEALIFNVQGNRTNNVVLNIGNRELRFKNLKDGEVCIYDNSGNLIHLKNDGIMELTAPQSVTVKTKTATITADNTTISGKTKLAGGDIGVALLGCTVKVDPNTHEGTITSASTEVTAI